MKQNTFKIVLCVLFLPVVLGASENHNIDIVNAKGVINCHSFSRIYDDTCKKCEQGVGNLLMRIDMSGRKIKEIQANLGDDCCEQYREKSSTIILDNNQLIRPFIRQLRHISHRKVKEISYIRNKFVLDAKFLYDIATLGDIKYSPLTIIIDSSIAPNIQEALKDATIPTFKNLWTYTREGVLVSSLITGLMLAYYYVMIKKYRYAVFHVAFLVPSLSLLALDGLCIYSVAPTMCEWSQKRFSAQYRSTIKVVQWTPVIPEDTPD